MNSKIEGVGVLIIKGVLFSLLVNAIVFSIYTVALGNYRQTTVFLTISFLLSYLFFVQPAKDYLFSKIVNRQLLKKSARSAPLEKRAANLTRREEIPDFLLWLCRHLRVPWLRMTLYSAQPVVHVVTGKGKFKITKIKPQDDVEFVGFLSAFPWSHKSIDMPPALRKLLAGYRINMVTPIIFRENIVGVIGLPRELSEKEVEATEFISRRIAIVLENDDLHHDVPRNEVLKKEFLIADRVEQYLTRDKPVDFYEYTVSRLNSAWEKKYFTALFELSNHIEISCGYILLCRLSIGSVRANALQLFGVQGYFNALAQGKNGLEALAVNLNRTLIEHENGKVHLDGFILQISKADGVSVIGFGSGLGIKHDFKWTWIETRYSLGEQEWSPERPIDLGHITNLVLTIRDFPLVYISRK